MSLTGPGAHFNGGNTYSNCTPWGLLSVSPQCANCTYQFTYTSLDGNVYNSIGQNTSGIENVFLGTGVYRCIVDDGTNQIPLGPIIVLNADSSGAVYPYANSYHKLSVLTAACGQSILHANYSGFQAYQWYRNNILIQGATSFNYLATLSGNYTCHEYNSCGWGYSDTLNVAISQTFNKPVITSSGPLSNCNNQPVILNTAVIPGAKYKWVANGLYNVASFTDSSSKTVIGTASYTVIVQNLCKTDTSASVSVTINTGTLPVPVINPANPSPTCNSLIALSSNSSPGLFQVQWNLNGTVIAGANSSTFIARTTGNYSVTFSNVCGADKTSSAVPVTLYANPSAAIHANGLTAFLQGDSVQLEATAGVGYAYQWMKNDVVINSTSRKIYAKAAGDFKVNITSTDGCKASSNQVAVIINKNKYVANLIIQPDSSGKDCYVSSFSPNFISPDNKLIYVGGKEYFVNDFYHTNGLIEFNLSTLPLNSIIEDARLSLYSDLYIIPTWLQNKSLIIQRNTSAWQEAIVNWFTHPSADTLHQVLIPLVPGAVRDYRNIYVKQLVKDMVSGSSQNFGFQLKILEDVSGSDYLQFISSDDERSSYRPRLVISYTPPCPATVSIINSAPVNICSGDSVELSTAYYPGYTYQWKNNGANINGATSPSYFAKTSGNYRVVVVTSCGTKNSQLVYVSVNAFPSANIISAGTTTFCSGLTDTLKANTGSGFSYLWYRNNVLIPGAGLSYYTATLTGNYKVLITNAQGCQKTSNVISLTVNPKPLASITPQGPLSFCAGDSVKLMANSGPGLSYQWRRNAVAVNGALSINYTAKNPGNYSVVTSNVYGCTKLSSIVTVTVPCRTGNEFSDDIIVYPNPSEEEFTIQFTNKEKTFITVMDMSGRIIEEEHRLYNNGIIGKNWPAGIYFLHLNSGNESRIVKLVKSFK